MSGEINLVVGCGFSGAVLAERIASVLDEKVLVIDRRNHIAGNGYDYRDENNIFVHKYGSHIFHTDNERVWKYVRRFSPFNTYMHRVVALIDGVEANIPFNFETLGKIFPKTLACRLERKMLEKFPYNAKIPILEFAKQDDDDLKFLANYIYEKVFLHYTEKQWGVKPDEIDSEVSARVPVVVSNDSRYFQDKYQGIPLGGYTKLIENILSHKNIELRLDTGFTSADECRKYKRVFYTGSVDELFNYKYGVLPYRSVSFEMHTFEKEFYQSNAVVNYPNNYDFTRVHEYKYYLGDKSQKTVVAKEYSTDFIPGENERYYPVLKKENIELYKKYLDEACSISNLYIFGRLGDYKYYDMDKAVLRALSLFDEVEKTA